MLNLRAHTGYATIGLTVGLGQRVIAVTPLVGEVLRIRRNFPQSFWLIFATIRVELELESHRCTP